jgi:hypothetical protein
MGLSKPEHEALLGKTFFLATHTDSGPETYHDATVIGVNVAGPDSLLMQLDPPLPPGMYAKEFSRDNIWAKELWRHEQEQFDKVVLLRRHAGHTLVPPGPFPMTVHIYAWPDGPAKPTINWNSPDDWGELYFSRTIKYKTIDGTRLPRQRATFDQWLYWITFAILLSAVAAFGIWRLSVILRQP